MFADPKKVAGRRLKRRLKAGASVALALVAGAFLACKGGANPTEGSPQGPDARPGPDASGNAPSGTASGPAAAGATSASPVAEPADAGSAPVDASTALVVVDAGAAAHPRAPKVDKHEHRKGMPVRDNLLE
jgi:hypothetical protein